jgi:hypothetical protein
MVSDLSKYIYLVYFGSVISFHFVGVQLAPETPSKEEILSSSTTVHADGPVRFSINDASGTVGQRQECRRQAFLPRDGIPAALVSTLQGNDCHGSVVVTTQWRSDYADNQRSQHSGSAARLG